MESGAKTGLRPCALLGLALVFAGNLPVFVMPQSWLDVYNTNVGDAITAQGQGLVWAISVAALLVPIAEETAFRGLMMTRLQGRVPVWLAAALPALVFAVAHAGGSMVQILGVLPLAVILGLVFLWTKSIRTVILIHILNNLIAVITPSIPILSDINSLRFTTASFIAAIIGLAVAIFALYMIYKRRKIEAVEVPE